MAAKTTLTHRLTEIETREVSLVDKAANRRKFLLVKAADGQGTEVTPDGKGGFKTAEIPGTDPAPETHGAPAAVTVTKATREALVSTIEKLTALANGTVEGESDAETLEASVNEALSGLAQPAPLHKAVEGLEKASPAELAKAATGCAAKLLEIASALALTTDAEDANYTWSLKYKISEVLEILVLLASLEKQQPGAAAAVAAAVGSVEKAEEPGVVLPAPVTQTSEKYQTLVKGLQSVLTSALTETPVVPVVESPDLTAAEQLMDQATQVIKAQKAQIAKLEAVPARSNAIVIEDAPAVVAKAKKAGGWQLDMAAKSDEDTQF